MERLIYDWNQLQWKQRPNYHITPTSNKTIFKSHLNAINSLSTSYHAFWGHPRNVCFNCSNRPFSAFDCFIGKNIKLHWEGWFDRLRKYNMNLAGIEKSIQNAKCKYCPLTFMNISHGLLIDHYSLALIDAMGKLIAELVFLNCN